MVQEKKKVTEICPKMKKGFLKGGVSLLVKIKNKTKTQPCVYVSVAYML